MVVGRATITILTLISVLALLSSIVPPTVQADEERELLRASPTLEFTSLRLVNELLSGRLWLIGEGMDPKLKIIETGRQETPILQAPGAGVLVPFRSPAPAFSRNILITRDLSATPIQTEPHIAVNPNDPNHLLVGIIDYNFAGVSAYVSLDGGETWEGPIQLKYLSEDLGSGGDPTVGFDRRGNAYFASISIGEEEYRVGALVGTELVSRIIFSKSTDGGFTWSDPISVASGGIFISGRRIEPDGSVRTEYVFTFLDKPWMSIGPDKADLSKDALYITYTEFAVRWITYFVGELVFFGNPTLETTIKLVKVTDEGRIVRPSVAVSPTVIRTFGTEEQPRRIVQGSQAAIGPDGTVYVAWLDTLDDGSFEGQAAIMVARSDDGGRTWTRPVAAAYFKETGFTPRNAMFRYWGSSFPQIAIAPNGDVFIVFVGKSFTNDFDDGDVYLVKSSDRGVTWSRPIRINDDDTGRLQFFPAITVDKKGMVHVIWGDMRDDPSEIRYHIYYTRSEDGGNTWGFEVPGLGVKVGSTRVTDSYSNPNFAFPNGLFIGDYFAITSTDNDVYAVWADARLGEFVGLNQKIGFARFKPVPSPIITISPTSGTGGRDVTITGGNFQPDSRVYIEVGGSVIAYTKTDLDGRFVTRLFMPISSEGSVTIRAYDQSGNVAEASFYVEYGLDSIRSASERIALMLEELEKNASTTNRDRLLEELAALKEQLSRQSSGDNLLLTLLSTVSLAVAVGALIGAYLLVRRARVNR